MSPKKKINIGIIGIDNTGKYYARVCFILKEVNLIAVSDINEKIGKEIARKFGCKFYNNYHRMLSGENLDAVLINGSPKLHKKMSLDVIKANKHLLIDKPIALNTKEAKEIIKAAEKAKVKLMVGHVERFNPAIQRLKEIVQKGILGRIISIVVRREGIFPPHLTGDVDVVKGLAIHDIDILTYLLNHQPTEVFGRSRKIFLTQEENSAEIFLSYNGISAFIQVNWVTPGKVRTLSVTGLKGYAELDYLTQKLEIYKTKVSQRKKIGNFEEFIKFGKPQRKEVKINKKEPLLCGLKSFVESIKKNKKPQIAGTDGLRALIIAEKAIKSSKQNKVIEI
jgi:UDP-N-acetylglucosamine 3-dehydrogenase